MFNCIEIMYKNIIRHSMTDRGLEAPIVIEILFSLIVMLHDCKLS